MPKKLEDARINWMWKAYQYVDMGWIKHKETIYQGGGVTVYYLRAGPKLQHKIRLKFIKIKDRQAYKKEWHCTCKHCGFQGFAHDIMCVHILSAMIYIGKTIHKKIEAKKKQEEDKILGLPIDKKIKVEL